MMKNQQFEKKIAQDTESSGMKNTEITVHVIQTDLLIWIVVCASEHYCFE